MITGEQCRAARGLLGWKAQDLAAKAEVGRATVARFEAGARILPAQHKAIMDALAGEGVRLVGDDGVRLPRLSRAARGDAAAFDVA